MNITNPRPGRKRRPDTGDVMKRIFKGQTYEVIGSEPYVRKDGKQIDLNIWQGRCAECGEPFQMRFSAQIADRFVPNRRCEKHKKPGLRVRELCEAAQHG